MSGSTGKQEQQNKGVTCSLSLRLYRMQLGDYGRQAKQWLLKAMQLQTLIENDIGYDWVPVQTVQCAVEDGEGRARMPA